MSMKKRDRKPAPPKDLVKTIYHIKHHELQIKEAEVLNEGYRLYEGILITDITLIAMKSLSKYI